MSEFSNATVERIESISRQRGADEIDMPELRRAAVLIALVPPPGEWRLLFHQRSDSVRIHRGQIAFPGGAVEEGESLEEAVLRETAEEIGVPAEEVRLVARMDDVITRTGYLVAPFVGLLPANYHYVRQESEVREIFEVPLAVLLAPHNPEVRYLTYRGEQFPRYYYLHEHREIWGLTGRMLKAFLDLVRVAM